MRRCARAALDYNVSMTDNGADRPESEKQLAERGIMPEGTIAR